MEQTLGKRIVMHRKRLGLTQDQLAESLGVTAQAVSKWENDQSCPDINMLPKLAQLFGTTVDALLGNDAQPVYEAEIVTPDEGNKDKWEFRWNASRSHKIAIAVSILLLGIQLIIGTYLQRDLSFWSLLWPTALFMYGLWGLYPRFSFFRFGCLLFGGYFLLDKWELPPIALGSEFVFPVVLVLLGLSLLVDAGHKSKKPLISLHQNGKQNCDYTCDQDSFAFDASFGSMTQVVILSHMSHGAVDASFGSYTLDLSQVATVSADCTISVDCSFGDVTLLVPRRFQVRYESSTSFGDVSVEGTPDDAAQSIIRLDADISFGKMIISYI